MHLFSKWDVLGLLAFAVAGSAAVLPRQINTDTLNENYIDPMIEKVCTNGPLSRKCWSKGHSVWSNPHDKVPDTGRTVKVCPSLFHCLYSSNIADSGNSVHTRGHKRDHGPRWSGTNYAGLQRPIPGATYHRRLG